MKNIIKNDISPSLHEQVGKLLASTDLEENQCLNEEKYTELSLAQLHQLLSARMKKISNEGIDEDEISISSQSTTNESPCFIPMPNFTTPSSAEAPFSSSSTQPSDTLPPISDDINNTNPILGSSENLEQYSEISSAINQINREIKIKEKKFHGIVQKIGEILTQGQTGEQIRSRILTASNQKKIKLSSNNTKLLKQKSWAFWKLPLWQALLMDQGFNSPLVQSLVSNVSQFRKPPVPLKETSRKREAEYLIDLCKPYNEAMQPSTNKGEGHVFNLLAMLHPIHKTLFSVGEINDNGMMPSLDDDSTSSYMDMQMTCLLASFDMIKSEENNMHEIAKKKGHAPFQKALKEAINDLKNCLLETVPGMKNHFGKDNKSQHSFSMK